MAEIVLKNIRKTFGPSVVAVDNLNLTIQSGSFVSLLGPSGCGKTTTLRMIAGLDTPDGGELYLDGKLHRTVDVYLDEDATKNSEAVWHAFRLKPGRHTLRLVVRGDS